MAFLPGGGVAPPGGRGSASLGHPWEIHAGVAGCHLLAVSVHGLGR